ncbi:hypothetical protein LTR08_006506 [Meristemomyces frigidus]|nr:hypothetical protein LTR08_006506 [Meristemomyces frigidus]
MPASTTVSNPEIPASSDGDDLPGNGEGKGKVDDVKAQCYKAVSEARKAYNEELGALKRRYPSAAVPESQTLIAGDE